jgi:hypothetical protein
MCSEGEENMLSRRVLSIVLVLSVVASFALLAVPSARADYLMHFSSVASSCDSGVYTVRVTEGEFSAEGTLQAGLFNVRVEVQDSDGTKLGEDAFGANYGTTHSGTVAYSPDAMGPTVTFYLYYSHNVRGSVSANQVEEVLADKVTVDASCKALPGCDVLIPLPSTAVVGEFKTSAEVYWGPGQLITNPPITIEAGKTYYVIGQDQSEQYYEVLLGCDFVWVLKSTVGPNFDDVWQGKPLPTTIVD